MSRKKEEQQESCGVNGTLVLDLQPSQDGSVRLPPWEPSRLRMLQYAQREVQLALLNILAQQTSRGGQEDHAVTLHSPSTVRMATQLLKELKECQTDLNLVAQNIRAKTFPLPHADVFMPPAGYAGLARKQ